MIDVLGAAFQKLTQLGGGSELVPLLVFCVVLVLLGLGVGIGIMRALACLRSSPEPDSEDS